MNRPAVIFSAVTYVLAFLSFPLIEWSKLSSAFITFCIGYGVFGLLTFNMGWHRYFAHRSFETGPFMKWTLYLGGAAIMIGSLAEWLLAHGRHHRHLNTPQDPTNRNRGFWYSHLGWAYMARPDLSDHPLMSDPFVAHTHKFHYLYFHISGTFVPLIIGCALGTFLESLLVAYALRSVVQQNILALTGSVCHREDQHGEEVSVNSLWVGWLALGEGFQKNHHMTPSDFRHGRSWYEFDVTALSILLLAKLGLVWRLRRIELSSLSSTVLSETG